MRGNALWWGSYSAAAAEQAQGFYERALEINPRSLDARIAIAVVLVGKLGNSWSSSFEQDEARTEQLLLEGLERDPNNAMAKAHPAVPGWSICSMRVPCAGDLQRARGGTAWL